MIDRIPLNLESNPSEYNRRLVVHGGYLFAIGGESGTIAATSLSNPLSFHVIQQYDEPVRSLAFSKDGQRVAVGFEDGNIDIYCFTPDQLEGNAHPFLGNPNAPNDTNSQDAFNDFFSQENEGTLAPLGRISPSFRLEYRFEASIRSLEFDPRCKNGKYYLAIASEAAPGFMIVDVTNKNSFQKYFFNDSEKEYNQGGVRSAQYSPDGNVIASLGMDGKLCFWSVQGSDPELEWELIHSDSYKVISKPDLGQFSDPADRSCYPVWNNDGSIIALPGDKDLQLRRRGGKDDIWMKKDRIVLGPSDAGDDSDIVAVAFDPKNEGFVVTSCRDGNVALWKLTKEIIRDAEKPEGKFIASMGVYQSLCTSILWINDLNGNDSIYFVLANGSVICMNRKEVLSFEEQKADTGNPVGTSNNLAEHVDTDFEGNKRVQKNISVGIEDDYDEHDLDLGEPTKKMNPFVADEAEEENLDELSQFDDVIADLPVNKDVKALEEVNEDVAEGDDYSDDYDHDVEEQFTRIAPQPPFAPSSTPLGARRILCWNNIGVVTSIEREGIDGSYRTIDISFTDSVSNRPVSFRDNFDFIVGTLGDEGALFASNLVDDELNTDENGVRKIGKTKDTGSHIYYHRFNTFGSVKDKDWYIALPAGERALGCATGLGWNAVVTNRQFMRFFTSSGIQGPIVCIKGDPVTLVGCGHFAAVFYHECNPLFDGTQRLGYSIFDGITGSIITEGSVSAISKGHSLEWAGFDDQQSLCVMDSDGMVSMLFHGNVGPSSSSWIPVLDTATLKKSITDTYWPISVNDGKFVCVPLKGSDNYPDAVRRPVTTSLAFKVPLARGSGGKSAIMDEISLRSNLVLKNKKFVDNYLLSNSTIPPYEMEEVEKEYNDICVQVDKVTLKLFFTFAQEGKVEKAFDLAHRLNLEKSLEIAITASERCNQRKLADKIMNLKGSRFYDRLNQEDDDEIEEDGPSETIAFDTSYRSITPLQVDLKRKEGVVSFEDKEEVRDRKNARRRLNPFAKEQKESPAKDLLSSPIAVKKPVLSRQSTFSADSRLKAKQSKHLL